ncbi:MAG: ABC transporter ATP-binding protein [Alphaproteobacteria bacterium]|nr:ABC transporter ATP-binding protein [Alphaproteobacteria bacterium]
MCSDTVIKVNNLGKCYHVYDEPSHRLFQFFHRNKKLYHEFWAVKDISFDVKAGETVGILGRNGGGKSTLLQLVCGTLNPTQGSIDTVGSIAALLELGSGMNPTFTGLENIVILSEIMGISKDHFEEILPRIIEFADIGEFINQPVKTYSSGMAVRLAFAVSVAREPNILVVDEALSVGDEAFRRKCFARIEKLRENGTTLLFVSHADSLVTQICDRALLLDGGELLQDGVPADVVRSYHRVLFSLPSKRQEIREAIKSGEFVSTVKESSKEEAQKQRHSESLELETYLDDFVSKSIVSYPVRGAEIVDPYLRNKKGKRVNQLVAFEEYEYTYKVKFTKDAAGVQFGMLIKDITGAQVGGSVIPGFNEDRLEAKTGEVFEVVFNFKCPLNPGTYFLNAGVQGLIDEDSENPYLHRLLDVVMFKVHSNGLDNGTGFVNVCPSATTKKL